MRDTKQCDAGSVKCVIRNSVMPVVLPALTSVKYPGGTSAQNGVKRQTFVMTPNLWALSPDWIVGYLAVWSQSEVTIEEQVFNPSWCWAFHLVHEQTSCSRGFVVTSPTICKICDLTAWGYSLRRTVKFGVTLSWGTLAKDFWKFRVGLRTGIRTGRDK